MVCLKNMIHTSLVIKIMWWRAEQIQFHIPVVDPESTCIANSLLFTQGSIILSTCNTLTLWSNLQTFKVLSYNQVCLVFVNLHAFSWSFGVIQTDSSFQILLLPYQPHHPSCFLPFLIFHLSLPQPLQITFSTDEFCRADMANCSKQKPSRSVDVLRLLLMSPSHSCLGKLLWIWALFPRGPRACRQIAGSRARDPTFDANWKQMIRTASSAHLRSGQMPAAKGNQKF